jgi:hypothetical protein
MSLISESPGNVSSSESVAVSAPHSVSNKSNQSSRSEDSPKLNLFAESGAALCKNRGADSLEFDLSTSLRLSKLSHDSVPFEPRIDQTPLTSPNSSGTTMLSPGMSAFHIDSYRAPMNIQLPASSFNRSIRAQTPQPLSILNNMSTVLSESVTDSLSPSSVPFTPVASHASTQHSFNRSNSFDFPDPLSHSVAELTPLADHATSAFFSGLSGTSSGVENTRVSSPPVTHTQTQYQPSSAAPPSTPHVRTTLKFHTPLPPTFPVQAPSSVDNFVSPSIAPRSNLAASHLAVDESHVSASSAGVENSFLSPLPNKPSLNGKLIASCSASRSTPNAFTLNVAKQKHHTPVPGTPARLPALHRRSSLFDTKLLLSAQSFRQNSSSCLLAPIPQSPLQSPRSLSKNFCFADEFDDAHIVGSGCFFDVFRARGRRDGKIYAVKKSKNQFRGRADRDHYLREASSILSIGSGSNLHIVEVFQAWQEDGHFLIQMEYCPLTLKSLIRVHPLQFNPSQSRMILSTDSMNHVEMSELGPSQSSISEGEAFVRRVAHEISIGLMHVHSHEIVHLDIKPEVFAFPVLSRFFHFKSSHFLLFSQNILVSTDGVLKIGDFGSAIFKNMQADGSEGDAVYQAPELFSREVFSSSIKHVHTAADIFSLGLMLFQMATQIELKKSGFLFHYLRNGGGREYLRGLLTQQLEDVVMLCLDPNPDHRPSANELVELHLWPTATNS